MKPEELIQRSPEWWAYRAGRCTASRVADVAPSRTKTRAKYLRELVAERLSGIPIIKRVPGLEARGELEPEARLAYEFYHDCTVKEVGFIDHPTIEFSGCSPDGIVGRKGGIEIKCCDSQNHIEVLKTGIIDPDYLAQIQFNMACTKRAWWDYVSFDPRMPEDLKLFVKRIIRDDHAIAKLETQVMDFLAEVDRELNAIRNGGAK